MDTRVLEFLLSLQVPQGDAEAVVQVTQSPDEALAMLGRGPDGAVALRRGDICEWLSTAEDRYYYSIKGHPGTNWHPPAAFGYSEWALDADLYGISLRAARDVYLALDALLRQHPPGVALPAISTIAKVLGNVADCGNSVERYRTVRLDNEAFRKKVGAVPGATDVLLLAGFKIAGDALVLPEGAALGALRAAAARARRLADRRGHSGEATPDASGSADASATRPESPYYGAPGFQYQERIYHCCSCDAPINDGSERLWSGRHDAPPGEYRYECTTCPPEAFSLCQVCWDGFQAGAPLHAADHAFRHVGPRMSRHNDYYGTRGDGEGGDPANPWGNRPAGGGYARGVARLSERYGLRF